MVNSSAGHHKTMYTHRNEKKRHKTLWKNTHTHKNTNVTHRQLLSIDQV